MIADEIISIIEKRLEEKRNLFRKERDNIKQIYDQPFWECKFIKPVIDELEELMGEIKSL